MSKVLIIKLGHSETFDKGISNVTSYGDVLRSTVLLHLFKNDHVTWLADESATPILKNNPYISRVLIYNLTSALQLQSEHFDTVINLEKVPGLCALSDSIHAWRRFGFRFDCENGEAEAYEGSQNALHICRSDAKKKKIKHSWQEHLYEIMDQKWKNQEYVFGYSSKEPAIYDIGFNYQVGKKWLSKGWSMDNWKKLEELLSKKYSISWQQGLENMEEYFAWINKCRLVVTNDSFGMHVALALKKKVVAIFGSTNPHEIFMYGRGIAVYNQLSCKLRPCNNQLCAKTLKTCEPSVEATHKAVLKLF